MTTLNRNAKEFETRLRQEGCYDQILALAAGVLMIVTSFYVEASDPMFWFGLFSAVVGTIGVGYFILRLAVCKSIDKEIAEQAEADAMQLALAKAEETGEIVKVEEGLFVQRHVVSFDDIEAIFGKEEAARMASK